MISTPFFNRPLFRTLFFLLFRRLIRQTIPTSPPLSIPPIKKPSFSPYIPLFSLPSSFYPDLCHPLFPSILPSIAFYSVNPSILPLLPSFRLQFFLFCLWFHSKCRPLFMLTLILFRPLFRPLSPSISALCSALFSNLYQSVFYSFHSARKFACSVYCKLVDLSFKSAGKRE